MYDHVSIKFLENNPQQLGNSENFRNILSGAISRGEKLGENVNKKPNGQ